MTMETNQTGPKLVVIVYGELNAVQHGNGELRTIVIGESSLDFARSLALEFIQVIPDDLEWYQAEIAKWDGKHPLELAHQDDDHFYFMASASHLLGGGEFPAQQLADFQAFVAANNADPDSQE